MSWRLEKDFRFEASHVLPQHSGKCARLHGHSWKVTVVCKGNQLQEGGSSQGMLTDYSDISSMMKPLLDEYLDHWHLNDSLKMESPTSELVARWIYERLDGKVLFLDSVLVEETCTARCEYRK